MKSYKLLLSVLALAAVAASPALRAEDAPATPPAAGAPEHKAPKGGDRLKMLIEKLGLSDAQVAQIKPILIDEMKALKALHDDTTTDKKAKHQQMIEIRKSHADQILAILTPDQQTKFKAMQEQHRKGPSDAPKPTT